MNRIQKRFAELKAKAEPAFIPYITAGDPSLETTRELALALDQAGVDIIELGIPFSDPVGDGVVIQEAAQRALEKGTTLKGVIECVKEIRKTSQIPILFMTYFNPVLAYGLEAFAKDVAEAGVDGVLCVDLPPEEAEEYKALLDARDIATIFLVAPSSTPERVARIAGVSTGFVYCVSRTGVTGERASVEAAVEDMVTLIRKHTDTPIAVGFGIANPEQAAQVAGFADGVIVGSAIVRLIAQLGDAPETPGIVREFATSLVRATKGGQ